MGELGPRGRLVGTPGAFDSFLLLLCRRIHVFHVHFIRASRTWLSQVVPSNLRRLRVRDLGDAAGRTNVIIDTVSTELGVGAHLGGPKVELNPRPVLTFKRALGLSSTFAPPSTSTIYN